jgi:hypothetical protein
MTQDAPLQVDQNTLTMTVSSGGETETITLAPSSTLLKGAFVPWRQGTYDLLINSSSVTSNGVPVRFQGKGNLEIQFLSSLQHNLELVQLGNVHPGGVFSHKFQVSNSSDSRLSVDINTQSKDFQVSLFPQDIEAGAQEQDVTLQFQIAPNAQIGEYGTDLLLTTHPEVDIEPSRAVPLHYVVISAPFLDLGRDEYNLGYVRPDEGTISLPLDTRSDSLEPLELKATPLLGTLLNPVEINPDMLEPPQEGGEWRKQVAIMLQLSPDVKPGEVRGTLQIASDPPVSINPSPEI